jgi:hypothetical protein
MKKIWNKQIFSNKNAYFLEKRGGESTVRLPKEWFITKNI